jgi:hypothetical protein
LTAARTRTQPASETAVGDSSGHGGDGPTTGVAVGIAVGCVAGVAFLSVGIVGLCRCVAARKTNAAVDDPYDMYDEGGRSPILERQTARQ